MNKKKGSSIKKSTKTKKTADTKKAITNKIKNISTKKSNHKTTKKTRKIKKHVPSIKEEFNDYAEGFKAFYKNNKALCIVIALALTILLVILFYNDHTRNYTSSINKGYDYDNIVGELRIKYENGKDISFNKFNHNFVAEKKIIIENLSEQYVTYNMEWKDVKNTLVTQSNFTYVIESTGNNAGNLGISQVPVTSSRLFNKLLISPNKKHVYTITFTYKKTFISDDGMFKGYINIYK